MPSEGGVDVDVLIAEIKDGFALAGLDDARDQRLRITGVGLTLEVVLLHTLGGGLKLRVPFIGVDIEGGRDVSETTSHTVEMTFDPFVTEHPAATYRGDIASQIAQTIETVRATMVSAEGGNQPWALRTGTVEIRFGVTSEDRLSIGLSGSKSREHTNTLRLEIAPA
jgi:hypothetical protein